MLIYIYSISYVRFSMVSFMLAECIRLIGCVNGIYICGPGTRRRNAFLINFSWENMVMRINSHYGAVALLNQKLSSNMDEMQMGLKRTSYAKRCIFHERHSLFFIKKKKRRKANLPAKISV